MDWTSLTTRFLSDPAYLPLAGEVNADLSYGYGVETSDLLQANPFNNIVPPGTETQHHDRDSNNFGGALRYGITDDISVDVILNTGNERDQATYLKTVFLPVVCPLVGGGHGSGPILIGYHGGSPSGPMLLGEHGGVPGCPYFLFKNVTEPQNFRFIGMSNPDFRLTWRAVSEAWAPINVDLSLNYIPDLFANRDATPNSAGTLAGGGQHVGFTTNISYETEPMTLAVFGTVGYTDRQSTSMAGSDQTTAGHFNYTVGLQSQTRLTERLSLNLGSSATWSYRYSLEQFGMLPRSVRPGTSYAPYAGLVVRVIPDRLNCVLRYEHDMYGDHLTSNFQGPQSRSTQDEANNFTLTLSYRF